MSFPRTPLALVPACGGAADPGCDLLVRARPLGSTRMRGFPADFVRSDSVAHAGRIGAAQLEIGSKSLVDRSPRVDGRRTATLAGEPIPVGTQVEPIRPREAR